jgi:hypothetical protein
MKKWIFTAFVVTGLVLPVVAIAGKDPTGSVLVNCGTAETKIKNWSATFNVDPGEDGCVYSKDGPKKHKLNEVKFSFKSDGDVQGGAPRWVIPIDTNGDQRLDDYAVLDAAGCGATVGTTDDVTVSTSKDDCLVTTTTLGTYANWAAFAAANPTVKVAKKDIVFIEADVPGNYHVFDFQFG